MAKKIIQIEYDNAEQARQGLPDKNPVITADFRGFQVQLVKAGVIKQPFKIAFGFMNINNYRIFRKLSEGFDLVFVNLDARIKKLEKTMYNKADMPGQIAGKILMSAYEYPVNAAIIACFQG